MFDGLASVLSELVLRFVIGGAVVSLFAALGEAVAPKTFSGLFGAAPSVALASLAMAFAKHGANYVAIQARTMTIGAVALYVYGAVCVMATRREHIPVWAAAYAAWIAWLVVAFAIFALARKG
jgi:Protein of unknown function (DUF3147)